MFYCQQHFAARCLEELLQNRARTAEPKIHQLKTWPEFFQAIVDGSKTFELRLDDRDFEVGELLCLQEFSPLTSKYTGREVLVEITYKFKESSLLGRGLAQGFCILSFKMLQNVVDEESGS